MGRRVTISTPLGDALQFRELNGREAMSELFEFDIELISDSKTIDPKALLGQSATLISYHFEHSEGQHTLVLGDDTLGSHSPLPGYASVPYYPPDKAAIAPEECFSSWELVQQMRPGRHYNDDYDFKKPKADLSNMRQMPPGHAHDRYEVYEWPGGFTEFGDGETYVRLRTEEHQALFNQVRGSSNVRGLAPGYLMGLTNYPREDQNQQYLITGVNYHFAENTQVSDATSGSLQRLDLEAIPASVSYRPERLTPKPRTTGPQTAVVVGPPGEEIWTDQYGRIKVQFFWDRLGKFDQNSSCWLRVSAPWAGSNFGGIFIPRIGQEIVVDFLNGDPDYPIVTGCVYNADQMPPWSLPANATQSGIKTRSSKGGAPGAGLGAGGGDANIIQFEDKAGAELLTVHAQRDQLTEVEHDETKWVGNDRKKNIDRDETTVVGRDRTETVNRNETITVHGQRSETVDGNETITIHSARQERVDQTETISIGQSRSETVGASESVSIGSSQSLSVGSSRSKTVGSSESASIGTSWSIKVGTMKTETVGVFSMQNVGVIKMSNVGVAYNRNVGAAMLSTVGMSRTDKVGTNHTSSVGSTYSLTAGAGGGGGGPGGAMNVVESSGGSSGSGGSNLTMDATSITLKVGSSVMVMKDDGTITLNGKQIAITAQGGDLVLVGDNVHAN